MPEKKKVPTLNEVFKLTETKCPTCGDPNAYMPFNSNKLDCPTCKAGGKKAISSYSREFDELRKKYDQDPDKEGDAFELEIEELFGRTYGELLKKLDMSRDGHDNRWADDIREHMDEVEETEDDPIQIHTLELKP